MRRVVVVGSTGSVGAQAMEVIGRYPTEFQAVAIGAGAGRIDQLARQAADFAVATVSVPPGSERAFTDAFRAIAPGRRVPELVSDPAEIARIPDTTVLNAMSGAVGLGPTIAALEAGNTLALANKESLVAAGPIVTRLARPGQIVPVDSEHSAIAQCLGSPPTGPVARLIITASGGPFRGCTRAQLEAVTAEQALHHPTWNMGPGITLNSATLVNKGLEVIEARVLFDIDYDQIDVVVHPQSIVHSMVEFSDGATLAMASPPDMRLPIALGLSWPERVAHVLGTGIDFTRASSWSFEPLDEMVFPAVALAKAAGRAGGSATAAFLAANEVASQAFMERRIRFPEIVDTIAAVLDAVPVTPITTLAEVQGADRAARAAAESLLQRN